MIFSFILITRQRLVIPSVKIPKTLSLTQKDKNSLLCGNDCSMGILMIVFLCDRLSNLSTNYALECVVNSRLLWGELCYFSSCHLLKFF